MLQIFKFKTKDLFFVSGALLGGLGLAIWSNPQWYYKPEEEYSKTGVMLNKIKGINNRMVSSELNSNFFTYHNIEGCSFFRNYCLKKEALKLRDDLVSELTQAAYEIHSMCLEVVERVVSDDVLLEMFEIPDDIRELCKRSWKNRQTDFLGRFDFIYDGLNCPKLLEYNADTPTILVESGIGQNILKKHFEKSLGQELNNFNFLENSIKFFWKSYFRKNPSLKNYCLVTDTNNIEELQTMKYMNHMLEDSAKEENKLLSHDNQDISNLNFLKENGFLTEGSESKKVDVLWKLYPYEWLNFEEIGRYFEYLNEKHVQINKYLDSETHILEPYWKLILSSKALLPFLWEMYPNHPNLLPAYFESPKRIQNSQAKMDFEENEYWVAKTKFGREGNGVEILNRKDETNLTSEITLDDGLKLKVGSPIYQAFLFSMRIQRMYPTFGVWIVNGLPTSIGIRLCNEQIAKTDTSFVAHYLDWNKKFVFKCTQRQKDLRNSLYGDDSFNAQQIYGTNYFPSKIDFGTIDQMSEYYKKYHSKTEIHQCHCGGGCASYSKSSQSYNNRTSNSSNNNIQNTNTEYKGGRKYPKVNVRKSTGSTSKSFSCRS